MIKEFTIFFRNVTICSDAALIVLSFLISYYIRNDLTNIYPLAYYAQIIPTFTLIWVGALYYFGLYKSFRTRRILDAFWIILEATVLSFILFTHFLYILKMEDVSRGLVLLSFIIGAILLAFKMVSTMWGFRYIREKGLNTKNVLLLGTGRRAQTFIELVQSHPEWGIHIIGLVDENAQLVNKVIQGYKVIGTFKDIPHIIHNNIVDEVMCVVPALWIEKIQELIHHCEIEGVSVNIAVDIYDPKISRMKINDLFPFPILTFESTPENLGHMMIKRVFDIIVASFALIILSPVFLMVSLLIKITSPGPIFYKQLRCGRNGRKFMLYKFRTMQVDAEKKLQELLKFNEMKGAAFKMENDPRIIPVGRFLRKFSIDELPQFFNVLVGDMSIVGPRPPIPTEVNNYDDWQRRRLRMRPGITCLWQINGRNKITDFNEWTHLDLEYMDNWSLRLDFEIFLKTIPVVLKGTGAK